MKKIVLLFMSALLLTSCYTTSMQGSPAAVSAGASIGGMLGSIVGDRAGGYNGSQFGALVGTVAGAVVGNVVTTPRREKEETVSMDEQMEYLEAVSGVKVTNIRFIDDNRNHIIDAGECCKLVFELVNESEVPVYNVVPVVEVLNEMKHIAISPSVQVAYMAVGERIRYTATVVGGKKLKAGEAMFRIYTTESNGMVSEMREFSLPTANRKGAVPK